MPDQARPLELMVRAGAALSRLQINNVRNLRQQELRDLRQVNIFFGRNGSGKTSVLEAVHLLGMARSFRGTGIKPVISHGESGCTVFGTVAQPSSSVELPLGVRRGVAGEIEIKVGGQSVRTASQLVEHLPLQVINADSFDLLTGSPLARRQYLDWGVFHVEHRFIAQWQRFKRCIKQRNKLLRRGKIPNRELAVWTQEFASAGNSIGDYREAYFALLLPGFRDMMARLIPGLEGLDLRYRRGWDKELSLEQALEKSSVSDREQGYTHIGPQRADIRVLIDGHLAADTLSRGQQKLVVCGLKLAQGQLMAQQGGGNCAYLVDDLPSELDEQHSRLVCETLATMQAQVFITCVDRADITRAWPEDSDVALFHVEHGVVQRYPATGS